MGEVFSNANGILILMILPVRDHKSPKSPHQLVPSPVPRTKIRAIVKYT